MSQIDLLYRLQQIDDEVRADKKRLGEVMRLQAESSELVQAQQRATTAATELGQWRARQNDLNLELNSLVGKAQRSEERLYSGLVHNPKELADLQNEIDFLNRRRQGLEDVLLEAMIMLEEAVEADAQATSEVDQIQHRWEKEQQALKEEQAGLVERVNVLASQRNHLLARLTPQSLAAYESTGRRVGAVAVVTLDNDRCVGCKVRVPANLVKAANEGQLVYCDSCGRILCPN
jgi:predicted  nucleic acid-binding Zn-ribbon protein